MQQPTSTQHYVDLYAPDGRHMLVRVDRHHDHTAVTVVLPMDTSLDRAFPAVEEADAYIAFLWAEVEQGTQVWLIEERAAVLTSASAALDHIDTQLAANINATLDSVQADLDAQHHAEQAKVADIVAALPKTGGWNTMRRAHTRTGKPMSQPMDRILNTAVDGYIRRGRDARSDQLIALEARGKVRLDVQHGRICGAWLAGRAEERAA